MVVAGGWYVDGDVRWLSAIMKNGEGNENESKISEEDE